MWRGRLPHPCGWMEQVSPSPTPSGSQFINKWKSVYWKYLKWRRGGVPVYREEWTWNGDSWHLFESRISRWVMWSLQTRRRTKKSLGNLEMKWRPKSFWNSNVSLRAKDHRTSLPGPWIEKQLSSWNARALIPLIAWFLCAAQDA